MENTEHKAETATADNTAEPAVEPMAPAKVPAPPAFIAKKAKQRSRVIKLEWPLEYDGKVYESVTVRRMSVAEVAQFIEAVGADGRNAHPPMFDVPREVIDALDPDDAETVNAAVLDFLPRGLRTASEQPSQAGDLTSP